MKPACGTSVEPSLPVVDGQPGHESTTSRGCGPNQEDPSERKNHVSFCRRLQPRDHQRSHFCWFSSRYSASSVEELPRRARWESIRATEETPAIPGRTGAKVKVEATNDEPAEEKSPLLSLLAPWDRKKWNRWKNIINKISSQVNTQFLSDFAQFEYPKFLQLKLILFWSIIIANHCCVRIIAIHMNNCTIYSEMELISRAQSFWLTIHLSRKALAFVNNAKAAHLSHALIWLLLHSLCSVQFTSG